MWSHLTTQWSGPFNPTLSPEGGGREMQINCLWGSHPQLHKTIQDKDFSLFMIIGPYRAHFSVLDIFNPEYSLEGLMLNWNYNILVTWCKEPTHWKRSWCLERLRAGRERSDRLWDSWMASLTQWTLSLNKLWEIAKDREAWRAGSPWLPRVWHDWVTEKQQQDVYEPH